MANKYDEKKLDKIFDLKLLVRMHKFTNPFTGF